MFVGIVGMQKELWPRFVDVAIYARDETSLQPNPQSLNFIFQLAHELGHLDFTKWPAIGSVAKITQLALILSVQIVHYSLHKLIVLVMIRIKPFVHCKTERFRVTVFRRKVDHIFPLGVVFDHIDCWQWRRLTWSEQVRFVEPPGLE